MVVSRHASHARAEEYSHRARRPSSCRYLVANGATRLTRKCDRALECAHGPPQGIFRGGRYVLGIFARRAHGAASPRLDW